MICIYSDSGRIAVDCCEMRGMGIQLSKLEGDVVRGPKGKQQMAKNAILNFMTRPGDAINKDAQQADASALPPKEESNPPIPEETCKQQGSKNALLNFITRSSGGVKNTSQVKASALPPDSPPLNFEGSSPEPDEEALPPQPPELDPAESSSGRRQSIYELPSMSQMDTSVFNHLPDDLKAEILGEYKRKGVVVDGIRPGPSDPSAGPSTSAEGDQAKASASVNDPAPQGRSYDAIRSVTDIDPDYWAALPDEIKAEIEGDIRRRQAAADPPPASKNWNAIFKGRKSPVKAATATGKRKGKAEASKKVPAAFKAANEAQKMKVNFQNDIF